MKTKLKIAAFAAIAAAGCIAGISKSRTAETSAITLINVEALTKTETDGWTEIYTFYSKDYTYPTFTRHMTFHDIICKIGGDKEDCSPSSWTTYYDTPNQKSISKK